MKIYKFLLLTIIYLNFHSISTKKFNDSSSKLIDFKNTLRQVNLNTTTTKPITENKGRCYCANGICTCCSKFLMDTWKQRACVNVTYDPDEFSFTAKLSMNDRVLYTRTVSGKNPRPICVPVPRIPSVRACVRFYNIYFQGRNVHACVSMEGKFSDTTVFKVGLDCLRLGSKGVAVVKPEDGGGLGHIEYFPQVPEDESDDYDDDDDEEESEEEEDDDDDYISL